LQEAITGASAEGKVNESIVQKPAYQGGFTKVNSTHERDIRKISYVKNAERWDITDATVIQADTRTDFLCLNRKDDLE